MARAIGLLLSSLYDMSPGMTVTVVIITIIMIGIVAFLVIFSFLIITGKLKLPTRKPKDNLHQADQLLEHTEYVILRWNDFRDLRHKRIESCISNKANSTIKSIKLLLVEHYKRSIESVYQVSIAENDPDIRYYRDFITFGLEGECKRLIISHIKSDEMRDSSESEFAREVESWIVELLTTLATYMSGCYNPSRLQYDVDYDCAEPLYPEMSSLFRQMYQSCRDITAKILQEGQSILDELHIDDRAARQREIRRL